MKIYTNENNSQALKLLISANLAQKDVQPEIVNVDGKLRLTNPYGKKLNLEFVNIYQ